MVLPLWFVYPPVFLFVFSGLLCIIFLCPLVFGGLDVLVEFCLVWV
jgi:hypothetical protein